MANQKNGSMKMAYFTYGVRLKELSRPKHPHC